MRGFECAGTPRLPAPMLAHGFSIRSLPISTLPASAIYQGLPTATLRISLGAVRSRRGPSAKRFGSIGWCSQWIAGRAGDTSKPHRHRIQAVRTLMTQKTATRAADLARIQSEYREMPGLKLTVAQASRFW